MISKLPVNISFPILLLVNATILTLGAVRHFVSVDELAHLPAGVSHWKFERFDMYRVNPPLIRMLAAAPSLFSHDQYNWKLYTEKVGRRPEFALGLDALRNKHLAIHLDYVWPRIVCIFLSLLGAMGLSTWIHRTCGPACAIIACAYWCFCPNILAFGQTICPDVGAVVLGVLSCFAFSRYSQSPTFKGAMIGGGALGVALLTKMTWVIGIAVFPSVSLIYLLTFNRHWFATHWIRFLTHMFIAISLALLVLNAGYLFEKTGVTLREYKFCCEALGGEGCSTAKLGNRFKDHWIGHLPIPLPKNYILGIDFLEMEVEQKMWSFLLGEWRFGSWPYYYIFTTLCKTPEPTMIAAAVGIWVVISGIRRRIVQPDVFAMLLFLTCPAVAFFASVSLKGGFNHHHRYVLMIYPPMFALAAYIASPVGIKLLRFRVPFLGAKKRSIAVPLALMLVTLSAASALQVHPYYTSYFNTLSGGPENGWRLLGFSNIDWGQDILEVDKWLKANPDKRPLVMDIDYFGMNGNLFDVSTIDPPQLPQSASIDEVRKSITETQWWIISVKKLYNFPGLVGLEYLQPIEPVERIAYAYHVYRIDPLPTLQGSPELHNP